MKLGIDDVKKYLPHREPILLLDGVVDYEDGTFLHAQRHFKENDPVFEGHFPGSPIMPGVLGVEALAQAAAMLVNLTTQKTAEETIFLFMSIDKVKFKQPVYPGDTLDLLIKQIKKVKNIYKFEGQALKNDKLVTQATFMAQQVVK